MPEKNPQQLVTDIMQDTRIAMLTYIDGQDRLVSLPMATQDFDDPSLVWFITHRDTEKIDAINTRPQVNVAYSSDKGYVSLSALARPVNDEAKLKELWSTAAGLFTDSAPEDTAVVLLEVRADSARYWESPSAPVTLVKLIGAKLTDEPAEPGQSGVVDL